MERHQLGTSPRGPLVAGWEDAAVPAVPRWPFLCTHRPVHWEMHVHFVFVQKSKQQAFLEHFLWTSLSPDLCSDS